ncbi:MAG: NusG domain II-containing protein [Oscillospiraceae bacterium]|nr:NusG domain II-containing protein [Oscillospiraceae bacterium]
MNKRIIAAAVVLAAVAIAGTVVFLLMGNWRINDPYAEIYRDGELIKTVSLYEDTEFTVYCGDGYNVVTVGDGKICVSSADCPDKVCVRQGKISGAVPIVCLPHRLEIRVVGGSKEVDA